MVVFSADVFLKCSFVVQGLGVGAVVGGCKCVGEDVCECVSESAGVKVDVHPPPHMHPSSVLHFSLLCQQIHHRTVMTPSCHKRCMVSWFSSCHL